MKGLFNIILLVFATICIITGLVFFCFSWWCLDQYQYSTQMMGTEAFGYFNGFIMLGVVFIVVGAIVCIFPRKYFRTESREKV